MSQADQAMWPSAGGQSWRHAAAHLPCHMACTLAELGLCSSLPTVMQVPGRVA